METDRPADGHSPHASVRWVRWFFAVLIRIRLQTSRVGVASGPDSGHNTSGADVSAFVFPDADDGPSSGLECLGVLPVSLLVAFKLRIPIARVYARSGAVLRAGVPETAVDEYRYPLSSEDNVGSYSSAVRKIDTVVAAVPVASCMEYRPEGSLGPGVASPVRLHIPAARILVPGKSRSHLVHRRSVHPGVPSRSCAPSPPLRPCASRSIPGSTASAGIVNRADSQRPVKVTSAGAEAIRSW